MAPGIHSKKWHPGFFQKKGRGGAGSASEVSGRAAFIAFAEMICRNNYNVINENK